MSVVSNNSYFDPRSLGGCALWLDAADNSKLTLSSDNNVTQWTDKSSNAFVFSNSTNYPLLTNNAINGLQAVNFINGYALYKASVSYSQLVTNDEITMFFIHVPSGQHTSIISWVSASSRLNVHTPDLGNIYVFDFPNSGTGYTRVGGTIANYITSGPRLDAAIKRGTLQAVRSYGSQVFSGTNSGSLGSNPSYNLNISGFGSAGGYYSYGGYIGEIIFYNRGLLDRELQQVEGYLAWKWGLQANLPTSHPYYYNALIPNLRLNTQLSLSVAPQSGPFSVFDPRSISGCALWLDAADPNATGILPTNNTKISTWVDKSRNTNVTQGNSSFQPTFLSSEFNNLPTIRFTGVGGSSYQFLQTSATSIYNSITTMSIFGVIRVISTPPLYPSPFSIQNKISFYLRGLNNSNQFSGTNIWTYNGSTNVASSNTIFPYDTNTLFCLSLTNTQQFFLNGSNSIASPSFSFGSGTNGSIIIGWSGYNANDGYNGYISEILVYTTNLTTSQRQQIEGYLAWKWGLQSRLPTTHPYAYNPLFPNLVLQNRLLASTYTALLPNRFSGLALWLDAADSSTIGLSGGSNIISVRDKSSNAFLFSNASGFTYNVTKFNGSYPSFYSPTPFISSTLGSNISAIFNQPLTVFIVGSKLATGTGYIFDGLNALNRIAYFSATGAMFAGNQIQSSSNILNGVNWVVSAIYNTTNSFGYLNGTQYLAGNVGTGNTSAGLVLGNRVSFTESWNGHICEILFYNSVLITSQRQQLEGYLAWKWNLQTSLPTTHPYALYPPN